MKIAILSKGPGNYSTKRLKEEAKKRGHEVRVINYAKCYVKVEQSKPVVRYEGKDLGTTMSRNAITIAHFPQLSRRMSLGSNAIFFVSAFGVQFDVFYDFFQQYPGR